MSSFIKQTQHPETKEWEDASWIDDFFGSHHYGVIFPSDSERAGLAAFVGSNEWKARALEVAIDPDAVPLETREAEVSPEPDNSFADSMDVYTEREFVASKRALRMMNVWLVLLFVVLGCDIVFSAWLGDAMPELYEEAYDALYLFALLAYGYYALRAARHGGKTRGYLDCMKDFIDDAEKRMAARAADKEPGI